MFEQTFVDGEGTTNKSWTVILSTLGQVTLVGVALLIPLIYTEALPKTSLTSFLTAPPPPPPPPPPPAATPPKVVKVQVKQFDGSKLLAPKVIPKQIAMIQEDEPPPAAMGGVVGGVPGGVPGGSAGGIIGGIIGGVPSAAPPPPPPPKKEEPKPKNPERIRVGGNVQAANLVRKVTPVYPPLAKQARIQGVVVLEAEISKEGTIENLKVITGHPLLIQAAIDAVKQWRYKPTMLNNEPVPVVTTVTVNFAFSQ